MANFNLDKTLEFAVQALETKNPLGVAEAAEVSYDEETKQFAVPFLGSTYLVSFPDGAVCNRDREENVPITNHILILHYLINATGQNLTGEVISFKELPDGAIYIDPFTRRSIKPMLDIFSGDPESLVKCGLVMGGKAADFGDVSVTVPVFPRVAITYVIWSGDEEFPASGTILFDSSARYYLPTEDYAMVSGTIIWGMRAILKKIAATTNAN